MLIKMEKDFRVFCGLLLLLADANCSKILIIVGHVSPSHYNVFAPIIEELSSRKHDITVQAYHTLKQPLPNVKEMKLPYNYVDIDKQLVVDFFRQTLIVGPVAQFRTFVPYMEEECRSYLNNETTKVLLASGKQYDLVIVDALFCACHSAVASLVGKRILFLYPNAWTPWKETAAPTPLSYVPNFFALMPTKMDFFQRFENVVNTLGLRYLNYYEVEALQQKVITEILPQAGTIGEIEKNVVFSLTNGDPVVNSPRPTMPNIVNCGGMHCRKAKPLPKDLKDFVESSGEDGFIIFGLGSNMKSEYLLPEELQAILSAFSRLKQKVVWKFEAELENIPKNVKITKWMPQQDLLGHPKARLFITHSGLLSLQEAIYHGVPVIGVPFFVDQRGNIMRMKELGIGEHLDFLNLTADGFYELILQVLNDKSYYENMKKYSAIFKDQPEKPLERAIFWIEYVIRHNGALHFRSAGEDLNFFQYFLLDVVGFILAVFITVVGLATYMIKFILSKICGKKMAKKESMKKIN